MALRYDIDAGMRSEAAAREILGKLLEQVLANADGVRHRLDVENLHDFRVAVRRARTLLPELKKVLPAETRKPFGKELAWLGKLTNVARDLDVHLEELGQMPAERQPALEPFLRLLRDRREREQERVLAGLDSPRYAALLVSWRTLVKREIAAGPDAPRAERPVDRLARKRIRRARRVVIETGAKIGPDGPAEELHRLRIRCKRLRYLQEFFRSLFEEAEIGPRIRELKRLQDCLGQFNDLQVQQITIRKLAAEIGGDSVDAARPWIAELGRRQIEVRSRFDQRFRAFASTQND